MPESHTADFLKETILNVFNEYSINMKTPILSDSGSNILAAFKDFNSIRCICHRIHTAISDAWNQSLKFDTNSTTPIYEQSEFIISRLYGNFT